MWCLRQRWPKAFRAGAAMATAAAMLLPAIDLALPAATAAAASADGQIVAPRPKPAQRPAPRARDPRFDTGPDRPKLALRTPPSTDELRAAERRRRARIAAVTSWGYQLAGLDLATAAASPYGMLVLDATTGLASGSAMTKADVERLRQGPDGKRRLVISYLSIGEAEDYRPDYFSAEYLSEDAPDWLLHENPQWKGNRIIRFCEEGWQKTILGDEAGRSVYNSIEPSPLYRLVELGLDGVYLDRVDVYSEVGKSCPDAARRMVSFVRRLAEHARKANPDFMVILQNAEELLQHRDMIASIDAIAKEDLFYGVDHTEKANGAQLVADTVANLRLARRAGRPVFFVDYVKDRAKIQDSRRRGEAEGFVSYFAPRDLDRLWLPGREF